jgi:hypothetical protein
VSIKFQTIRIDRSFHPWLAVTAGEVGILTRCATQSHDAKWALSLSIASRFSNLIVAEFLGETIQDEECAARSIVDIANDCVGNSGAGLLCTTWLPQDRGHLFLSCGTNRLLLVGNGNATDLIAPHSLALTQNAEAQLAVGQGVDFVATHLLGLNCKAADIRIASVKSNSEVAVVLATDVRVARSLADSGVDVAEVDQRLNSYMTSQHKSDSTHCIFYFLSD